ncbi:hypothetical protein ACLOJK_020688 [Asimina triloba]
MLVSAGMLPKISAGMLPKISAVLLVGLMALVYQAIQPPSPKICGSPDGPPITSSRVKLSDGRHLAYKEHGVPRDEARYKIVYVHGFDSCRHDALPLSQLFFSKIQMLVRRASWKSSANKQLFLLGVDLSDFCGDYSGNRDMERAIQIQGGHRRALLWISKNLLTS